MAGMTDTDRRWLVLLRDISHAVRIPGETRIVVSLVFDMSTGVVLATAVAANEPKALSQACQTALTRPAGGLAPRRPDQVLCSPGLVREVRPVHHLTRVAGHGDLSRIYASECRYTRPVAKHLVDIDEAALAAAQAELGTTTMKDTVNEALRRATVNRDRRVTRALDRLGKREFLPREDAWR
jgi:Arc/MetJ family transcription regulator